MSNPRVLYGSQLEPVAAPMTLPQWFALLVVGALLLIGVGLWQLAIGNPGAGVALIIIAIADVVFVAAVRRYGRKRPTR